MNKLRSRIEYSPLIGNETSNYRIVISFTKLAWFTAGLPFFGFIFCVFWSIIFNFEHATFTHCEVYNILPSVSAAIGHYRPQNNIWKIVIAAQAFIRAIVFIMYYYYYNEIISKSAKGLTNITLLAYTIENISLVTLSFWTSNDNYAFHKFSFILFLIMSLIHMSASCYIVKNCRNSFRDANETKSYTIKIRALIWNLVSIFLACYFFWRHNQYCEPFVYSIFALCEYMVVISNMGFHVTAAWDFAGRSLMITTRGIRII